MQCPCHVHTFVYLKLITFQCKYLPQLHMFDRDADWQCFVWGVWVMMNRAFAIFSTGGASSWQRRDPGFMHPNPLRLHRDGPLWRPLHD